MKKRWISIFVENRQGVLATIAGLFSAKSYNLDSLTVGTTEDPTISRMTIGVISDDSTYEQIKKQLNRCIEVIKVIDFTDCRVHMKETMFVKVGGLNPAAKTEIFQMAEVFGGTVIDYGTETMILQFVQPDHKNDQAAAYLKKGSFDLEIVRGGNTAIEAVTSGQ